MIVCIPSPLRSYTKNRGEVEGHGASLSELLANLEVKYPGIKFRMIDEQDTIRTHIKIFVNQKEAGNLLQPLKENDKIHIICALSGG